MFDNVEAVNKIQSQWVFSIVILLGLIESLVLLIKNKTGNQKGSILSLICGFLAFIPMIVLNKVVLFSLMIWLYNHSLFHFEHNMYSWILTFVFYDLTFYITHIISHKIRFFWCIHSVHHTSEEMKLTSGMRGSIFDFIYLPFVILWIPFLGIHPIYLITVESFTRLYGFYVHISEDLIKKQPYLEFLIITPSSHRVHHGINKQYIDKNFGEVLTIWDHLFCTWQSEKDKPIYGLAKKIDSNDFKSIQFSQFIELFNDIKSAEKVIDKFRYLHKQPNWKHKF